MYTRWNFLTRISNLCQGIKRNDLSILDVDSVLNLPIEVNGKLKKTRQSRVESYFNADLGKKKLRPKSTLKKSAQNPLEINVLHYKNRA